MGDIIFTIAIPTYNRSKFLDRCLYNIFKQTGFNNSFLEVIVSNNASTDNTDEIVKRYISNGNKINYILNEKNEGPDYNIAQCYLKAKGRYVLALGDDDILLQGSINAIIQILKDSDFGVVYLCPISFKGDFNSQIRIDENILVDIFDTNEAFISRVNYNMTFISSNIINVKALQLTDIHEGIGTNFIQLFPIITAIKNFEKNAIVRTVLVAGQEDNTGGYGLYEVFGTNLALILNKLLPDKKNSISKKLILNNLNITFFSNFTYKLKHGNTGFGNNISNNDIIKILKKNFYFWIFTFPQLFLPKSIAKFYLRISFFYGRLFTKANNKVYSK